MTITDPICIIEKMKDISKSVFWKAFRISTKNVSVMYTLICICFTSYASSASCSCSFSLRKGAILSTLADKSKTDCNEIKGEFFRDDLLWSLLVPQYPHSNYFQLCQTCQHGVSHWISSSRVWRKTSSSATFSIFIPTNLAHIGTGINNVMLFKKLNFSNSSFLSAGEAFRSIWLIDKKTKLFWFLQN